MTTKEDLQKIVNLINHRTNENFQLDYQCKRPKLIRNDRDVSPRLTPKMMKLYLYAFLDAINEMSYT